MHGPSRVTEKQQASDGSRSFNSAISRSASDNSSGACSLDFTRSTFRPNRVMTIVLSAEVYGIHFQDKKGRHPRAPEVGSAGKGKNGVHAMAAVTTAAIILAL